MAMELRGYPMPTLPAAHDIKLRTAAMQVREEARVSLLDDKVQWDAGLAEACLRALRRNPFGQFDTTRRLVFTRTLFHALLRRDDDTPRASVQFCLRACADSTGLAEGEKSTCQRRTKHRRRLGVADDKHDAR